MNQTAYQEIAKMINAFPQSARNVEALLLTFEEDLRGISDLAIAETAQRFRRNEIPDQSETFAPSIAEFVSAARRQEELISMRSRPRLAAPQYRPGPLAPFQITQQRLLAENAHLPVLFEDISFDQWRKMSREKQVPVNSKWVAALGIVYGPAPIARQSAA